MGTRADFYVGRGVDAEWLGSIAWDGYPDALPEVIKAATDELDFRALVEGFLAAREDSTTPATGWPWPWEDSGTTDYAYAYDDGSVHASCFGSAWFKPDEEEDEPDGPKAVFPKMTPCADPLHSRSGLIVLGT